MALSLGFKRRTSGCVCSGCVWVLVLVLVQQCGGKESFTESTIMKSTDELVDYSTPDLNLSYNSSTEVNAKAMEQLYYVTNFFIDIIQKKDLYPEGFFEVEDGRISTDRALSDWPALLRHHAGVVAVAAVGLVFAVLMPLVALFFCCCRCAGRCGGRTQPFEKRSDPCRRITFGVMLSAVAIIILFGVVCAFVTNEYMEDGIKTLPSKFNSSIDDTNLYINNTISEFDSLLIDNFIDLQTTLSSSLETAANDLSDSLAKVSNAVALNNLTYFVDGMKIIKGKVDIAKDLTNNLKKNATYVNERLKYIREDLMGKLNVCMSEPHCNKTYMEVQDLSNPANFTEFLDRYFPKLPDITDNLDKMDDITVIEDSILEGRKGLETIKTQINDTITQNSPAIMKKMQEAGDAIKTNAAKILDVIKNVTSLVDRETKPVVKDLDTYIKEYAQYRYYADISVSAVMLLILLCITLGLFYGFCGKRPDSGYGDDCCNKATGAKFLMLGVYVMFIFSTVLMIITLAHFLLGVVSERLVCQSLRHPDDSQLLTLLDKVAPLDVGSTGKLNITTVINSCHMNDSIYQVLQVSNLVNISEVLDYVNKYNIQDQINVLKDSISFSKKVTLLDQNSENQLKNLKNSSVPLAEFSNSLEVALNGSNLTELAKTLGRTVETLESQGLPQYDEVIASLKNSLRELEDLQSGTIQYMIDEVKVLNDTAHELEEDLKFNHTSLSEAVEGIIQEVRAAENYLAVNGSAEMSKLAEEFGNKTIKKIFGYLDRVVDRTMTEVGSCEPLSRVYNASLVATCNDILDPFNGFWASIGWCLVLFIPAIILSVKLASLYRKSDPYHAAIPDTEYLYDAYADRDNIPLANGPDKKNHHRRYNETYDNSSGYMGDYSAHLGRGERERRDRAGTGYHQEDTRYNDMAPKHWDYSNGALPRYHSPPLSTEYERPPPYYYPGPGDSGRR